MLPKSQERDRTEMLAWTEALGRAQVAKDRISPHIVRAYPSDLRQLSLTNGFVPERDGADVVKLPGQRASPLQQRRDAPLH